MIFDTNILVEKLKAKDYFLKLWNNGKVIEITHKLKKRTLSQNKYLHVLFKLFGIELGYSHQDAKEVVKTKIGYRKLVGGIEIIRGTRTYNTKEMSNFIENFRILASEQGIYLPKPGEISNELLNYIEQNGI